MPTNSVKRFAAAKVNLYLHVTGKREDGYHTLDSLMAFAEVGDLITVAPSEELRLSLKGPFGERLGAEDDNLVLRAARLLAETLGHPAQAHITLHKELPIASGIGGGSADAAATLKALLKLWGATLDPPTLVDLGLRLGADVPICLAGRAAFVGGIGEKISPAPPLPEAWLVLANPGVAQSTPAVFKARSGDFSPPAPFDDTLKTVSQLADLLKARRNDLTAAALSLSPEIAAVLSALERAEECLLSRMSGSGATCFGLFASADQARLAATEIAQEQPGWWVHSARLLSETE